MGRPALEVADIFRTFGPAWRQAQRGHLSLGQLEVMSAIEQCRTAALGGHVLRCEGCGTEQIAYNSCRNRHCPKCQSTAAQRWLDARQADLLPVEYYHVVFTLPAPIADIAYRNKAVVYGKLHFFGEHVALANAQAFNAWLAPLRKCEWVVYAKKPFAGPEAVLAYLSRYTHRVAISNSRLIALDERGVTFRCKDYRAKGRTRYKAMTLSPQEFMRRFLLHVLPGGFHRIRHYGLLANGSRRASLALSRELLCAPTPQPPPDECDVGLKPPTFVCMHCGRAMLIVHTFTRSHAIRAPPQEPARDEHHHRSMRRAITGTAR